MSNPSSPANSPFGSGSTAADAGVMGDGALRGLHSDKLRDKEEPSEGFSLIPIFFIFLFAGLIFWSGLYIVNRTGGFRADVYDPAYDARHPPPLPLPDPMVVGKRIFTNSCQNCHGSEGLGQPGVYPPLAGSPWPVGDPERAISILIAGMAGPVKVLDHDFNNTMPNLGQLYKDNEVAAVLTYVRNTFGNEKSVMDHDPVDESLVAQVRNELRGHPPYSPPDVLKAFPLETKPFVRPVPPGGAPAAGDGATPATGGTTPAGAATPGTPATPAVGTPGAAATSTATAPRAGG